jgi:hypothetical protein
MMLPSKTLIGNTTLAFLIAGYAGLMLSDRENRLVLTGKDAFIRSQALTDITESGSINAQSLTDLAVLTEAFDHQYSNIQVKQTGTIIKILPDDTNGSRHQRFIVRLNSGQSMLIAHNIDLAPRVEGTKEGSTISFYGEYEWNSKGGAIHWTHHNPQGQHEHGWLIHDGRRYD